MKKTLNGWLKGHGFTMNDYKPKSITGEEIVLCESSIEHVIGLKKCLQVAILEGNILIGGGKRGSTVFKTRIQDWFPMVDYSIQKEMKYQLPPYDLEKARTESGSLCLQEGDVYMYDSIHYILKVIEGIEQNKSNEQSKQEASPVQPKWPKYISNIPVIIDIESLKGIVLLPKLKVDITIYLHGVEFVKVVDMNEKKEYFVTRKFYNLYTSIEKYIDSEDRNIVVHDIFEFINFYG